MIPKNSINHQLLGEDGPFNDLSGFMPRRGQQLMASLVEGAFEHQQNIVIEAASGSGKTFAYLLPIILAGQKSADSRAVISTASHYLQNQLFRQDIPRVQQVLGTAYSVAILKGRNNYLCPYYLNKALQSTSVIKKTKQQLYLISEQFTASSLTGDLASLGVAHQSPLLPYLTSSSADCLNKQCPQYERCPLMLAKQKASNAKILVVNHSLLFSDPDFLLSNVNRVVIDEAHRLAEFSQMVVGEWLGSKQLLDFICEAQQAISEFAPDQASIIRYLVQLKAVVSGIHDKVPPPTPYKQSLHIDIVRQIRQPFIRLQKWFAAHRARSTAFEELAVRLDILENKLAKIEQGSGLCWVEPRVKHFVLQNIPATLTSFLSETLKRSSAQWVFTSATLSVAHSADKFLSLLGLDQQHFYSVDGEIDYQQRARLYMPLMTLTPEESGYTAQLVEKIKPILNKLPGRALLLFTSHRALQEAAGLLAKEQGYSLFIQGESDNFQLIEAFKQSPKGVLLGTGSFWEGLDLSGAKLSCVVIDKLPFASPSDPVVKLKTDYLQHFGVDSFQSYLLPEAVIKLRQGCGRLLRRREDKGILVLADPRLLSKDYGQIFLDSLPAMKRETELAPVLSFLSQTKDTDYEVTGDR